MSSSAECRIWTRVSGTESPADWFPGDKPIELSRIKLKNLNSIACPHDQRAFSPLNPTAGWLSQLALAKYIFVVVNFDALAQASSFWIQRRQVVFLCWIQDSNHSLWNRMPAEKPTELSIKDEAKKLELNSPSLWLNYQKKSVKDMMKNAIRNVWLITYQL